MRVLKKLLKNNLLLLLLNSVMIELAFVIVMLSVFHDIPEVSPDSSLVEIIRVFEE
jgi:hypothetical protein